MANEAAKPRTSAKICGMGHSMKRKEDPRFLQGKGNYIDDHTLPGMLWLDIVRSPIAYGKIVNIDSSKALEIDGVLAVLTGKDLEAYNLHWMPTLMSDTQMVLPTDTVMYQAQEVAGVIATSRYAAADGVAAVEVEYETDDAGDGPVQGARGRRARAPHRQGGPGPTTGSGTGRRATRRRRTRSSTRPTWSCARRCTCRAFTWPRSRRAGAWPTSTRSRGT